MIKTIRIPQEGELWVSVAKEGTFTALRTRTTTALVLEHVEYLNALRTGMLIRFLDDNGLCTTMDSHIFCELFHTE